MLGKLELVEEFDYCFQKAHKITYLIFYNRRLFAMLKRGWLAEDLKLCVLCNYP